MEKNMTDRDIIPHNHGESNGRDLRKWDGHWIYVEVYTVYSAGTYLQRCSITCRA